MFTKWGQIEEERGLGPKTPLFTLLSTLLIQMKNTFIEGNIMLTSSTKLEKMK